MEDERFICWSTLLREEWERQLPEEMRKPEFWLDHGWRLDSRLARILTAWVEREPAQVWRSAAIAVMNAMAADARDARDTDKLLSTGG
ncbi:hypothetical protein NYO99_08205 [Pelomonas sp. UHG3]|jgi:hypothetical protein|uniref:Uncharacterized protein n=1 Tax=Roseateles hydrophilus TaxID=2975054 RepID=A0ACC6C9K0_9BURK|nr:hypothetical protein [Pelomonas sp. UHG3]MCY4744950.1 hypothetical protein [Pelomonas sp. UHG3]